MKYFRKVQLLIVALALIIPSSVLAFTTLVDESIIIPKNENIDGNLYVAGNNISIDGDVEGDVFCAGQNIVVNGDIEGSVICAGQSILINGDVEGSVRIAGDSLNINSNIKKNLMTLGASVIVGDGAVIGWDALIGAAFVDIKGVIGKDLNGGAANVHITGKVGGDINLSVESNIKKEKKGITLDAKDSRDSNFVIGPAAVIGGRVNYKSSQDLIIKDGARVAGAVKRSDSKKRESSTANHVLGLIGSLLFSVISALLVGLLIIRLWGDRVKKVTDRMVTNATSQIGIGLIKVISVPVIALLLAITIVGIPLSLIILSVYFIALYAAKIIVGILVGRKVIEKYWTAKKNSLVWALVVGITILKVVSFIPLFGWITCFIATLWGIGAMCSMYKKK